MDTKRKRLSKRQFEQRVKIWGLVVPLLVALITTGTTLYIAARSRASTTYVVLPAADVPPGVRGNFAEQDRRATEKGVVQPPVRPQEDVPAELINQAEARRKAIDALSPEERTKALEEENARLRELLGASTYFREFHGFTYRVHRGSVATPSSSDMPLAVLAALFGVVFAISWGLVRIVVWRLRRLRASEPETA
jgi:hypothetical protein